MSTTQSSMTPQACGILESPASHLPISLKITKNLSALARSERTDLRLPPVFIPYRRMIVRCQIWLGTLASQPTLPLACHAPARSISSASSTLQRSSNTAFQPSSSQPGFANHILRPGDSKSPQDGSLDAAKLRAKNSTILI